MQATNVPFSTIRQTLRDATVVSEDGGFKIMDSNNQLFVVITPCVNIRANNLAFLASAGGCLRIYSVFLTADCPALYKDNDKRAIFFDILRGLVKPHLSILASGAKAVVWERIGSRISAKMSGTEIISYMLASDMPEILAIDLSDVEPTAAKQEVRIPYRGDYLIATSNFFKPNCTCDLFAYALAGNAFALISSDRQLDVI